MDGASTHRQGAGVGDFIMGDRTHLGGFDRHHGCGVAVQGDELHLVGQPIFIKVNHGAHVTRLQPLIGNRRGQNHTIMLFNHLPQAATGSCFKRRLSLRLSSVRAKVCPVGSRNSTSNTSGERTSTTVPTWPSAKPSAGLSTSSATTSRSLIVSGS